MSNWNLPPEPPTHSGDTQPVVAHGDTRPFTVRAARTTPSISLFWLLIGALGGLAVLTVFLFVLLRATPFTAAALPQRTVSLRVEDQSTNVTTNEQTVGELLAQQGVTLRSDQVVAPPVDTQLVEGMRVTVMVERPITVVLDGEVSVFRTAFDHPQEILDSLGIFVDDNDAVLINGSTVSSEDLSTYPLPAQHIEVRSGVRVTLNVDGEQREWVTTQATVGEVLDEAGVTLFLGDMVDPPVDTTVEEGMMITVERSSQVTITIGDTQIETRASGATVADALSAGEIILNGLDYTIPPENTRLTPDMNVRVVRVTEEVLAETEPLPYEVIYQADAELELDQQAVIQTGVEGVQQHNIRVRYEDGVEVSRTDEGLSVTQEPVDQIIAYGTNVVLRTIDTAEGPREYWRKLRLYATSYYPKALGGDNVTATGMTLQKGVVAIDPKLIPYDTQMYIPDYGIGIAGDTGGPRLSRYWIDLGYSDADWVHWARWTDVYLLTPVPPDIQYLLPAVQTPQ
jgi:uncharacterized protein YabE (DUF348 family)/3D (Asp-Asp-Asp) domain-containing protein